MATVCRDAGLKGVSARLLRRLLELFGRDEELNEWQRQKAMGDIEFDAANGTSTAGIQELFELSIVGKNARYGLKHIASDPNSFVSLLKQLNIDFANYSFIDLGSGKGRVLLLAASFPFRRIIGVEFAVELHNAAQENLALLIPSVSRRSDQHAAPLTRVLPRREGYWRVVEIKPVHRTASKMNLHKASNGLPDMVALGWPSGGEERCRPGGGNSGLAHVILSKDLAGQPGVVDTEVAQRPFHWHLQRQHPCFFWWYLR